MPHEETTRSSYELTVTYLPRLAAVCNVEVKVFFCECQLSILIERSRHELIFVLKSSRPRAPPGHSMQRSDSYGRVYWYHIGTSIIERGKLRQSTLRGQLGSEQYVAAEVRVQLRLVLLVRGGHALTSGMHEPTTTSHLRELVRERASRGAHVNAGWKQADRSHSAQYRDLDARAVHERASLRPCVLRADGKGRGREKAVAYYTLQWQRARCSSRSALACALLVLFNPRRSQILDASTLQSDRLQLYPIEIFEALVRTDGERCRPRACHHSEHAFDSAPGAGQRGRSVSSKSPLIYGPCYLACIRASVVPLSRCSKVWKLDQRHLPQHLAQHLTRYEFYFAALARSSLLLNCCAYDS
eukprot:IDg17372t1